MKPRLTATVIFTLLAGLGFIIGGVIVNRLEAREIATLREVQGTVVGSETRRETDPDDRNKTREVFAPVIEVRDADRVFRFTGASSTSRLADGLTRVVRYDPARPTASARMVDPLEGLTAYGMWGMGAILFFLGLRTLITGKED
jgi:hypothetical protein